ncbi:hypothetical protein VTN77DRAFT_6679 [Rasamsonia byssochlamydoides]|uniref:uncharacterized protein n=1 Tax=Rasamsonia byssochlamydoides TaxID=89139 RepID=UPI003742FDD5
MAVVLESESSSGIASKHCCLQVETQASHLTTDRIALPLIMKGSSLRSKFRPADAVTSVLGQALFNPTSMWPPHCTRLESLDRISCPLLWEQGNSIQLAQRVDTLHPCVLPNRRFPVPRGRSLSIAVPATEPTGSTIIVLDRLYRSRCLPSVFVCDHTPYVRIKAQLETVCPSMAGLVGSDNRCLVGLVDPWILSGWTADEQIILQPRKEQQ